LQNDKKNYRPKKAVFFLQNGVSSKSGKILAQSICRVVKLCKLNGRGAKNHSVNAKQFYFLETSLRNLEIALKEFWNCRLKKF